MTREMRAGCALMAAGMALVGCQPAGQVPAPNPVARVCSGVSAPSPVMPDGLVAYDRGAGYAIVVSQLTGVDQPADLGTWKWSCTWSRLTGPDAAPVGYAMAYDPALQMTILLGQKTMGWDGSRWTDLHATPPLNLGGTTLLFDAARNAMVLVDSYRSGVNTWTFDGHSWKKASTTGPQNAAGLGVAYDPRSKAVIAFGAGGTWRWDGKSWTLLHPPSSPDDEASALAYDEATSQMILINQAGQTWSWDGSSWTQLPLDGPLFSEPGGLVYDAAGRQLILWMTWKFWERSQTWTYSGDWAELP